MTRHVLFMSGGLSSWAAGMRVREGMQDGDTLDLVFTDVLGEDEDTYRCLISGANVIGGGAIPVMAPLGLREDIGLGPLLDRPGSRGLPRERCQYRDGTRLVVLQEGRTVFDVFRDRRLLGNSMADPCSRILKRELADRWIRDNFPPGESALHLGIGWSEVHRTHAIRRNWEPYTVCFPLVDPPYLTPQDLRAEARAAGVHVPELYELGFPHANCGGACVKAGHGQWAMLYRHRPELFAHWEQEEQRIREHLGADVSILRDRSGGATRPMTLREFREDRLVPGSAQIDMFDIGGCGCFTDYEEDGDA